MTERPTLIKYATKPIPAGNQNYTIAALYTEVQLMCKCIWVSVCQLLMDLSVSKYENPWWRHQMETFSALLTLCVEIHRSSVNSPHKCQGRGALMFSLIWAWINGWVNNREAGDIRRHRTHYDVIVMHCRPRIRQGMPKSVDREQFVQSNHPKCTYRQHFFVHSPGKNVYIQYFTNQELSSAAVSCWDAKFWLLYWHILYISLVSSSNSRGAGLI